MKLVICEKPSVGAAVAAALGVTGKKDGYPDKVFSKQNLYESIWQEPFARDNDVINTHISNLRKKLKGEGCRIKTIWGLGYRFAK